MTERTDIRETVRARYAAAATWSAAGNYEQAHAVEASCCGTESVSEVMFGAALYRPDETEGASDPAVAASLGCGVPTAVADLHPGETVLDLGSGAGADILISARRVAPGGRAIGLDMTPEMLDLARRNATDADVTNVEFVQGYLEDIPLPDSSVDVVISNCVINLAADKGTVLREAARVLRPGGRFAVSDVIADPDIDRLGPRRHAAVDGLHRRSTDPAAVPRGPDRRRTRRCGHHRDAPGPCPCRGGDRPRPQAVSRSSARRNGSDSSKTGRRRVTQHPGMHLVTEPRRAVDLTTTPIHLGLGSRALPVEGFEWDAGVLEAYVAAVSGDGAEGRLVMIFQGDGSGTHWERHPAGDEVVVCLSGRMTVIRELGGEHDPVELVAGQSVVNPQGVWHVVDMHQPGQLLTITPGTGTEHRPRHPGGSGAADDRRRAGPTVTRRRMA